MKNGFLDFENDSDVRGAVKFAKKVHNGQVRKKDGTTPYVCHALSVMKLLISCVEYEYMHYAKKEGFTKIGFSKLYKDVVIAGVLHDVVEDTHKELPRSEKLRFIAQRFGSGVAEIVDVMSEWKEDSYLDRKGTQSKRILDAGRGAKLVKCADVISNLGETVEDCKRGDFEAWKVYKIRPTQVVENHIDALGALQELQGNPLYAQLSMIIKESIPLAKECEDRLGTEFWDEKISKTSLQSEDDVERYFRETYKNKTM